MGGVCVSKWRRTQWSIRQDKNTIRPSNSLQGLCMKNYPSQMPVTLFIWPHFFQHAYKCTDLHRSKTPESKWKSPRGYHLKNYNKHSSSVTRPSRYIGLEHCCCYFWFPTEATLIPNCHPAPTGHAGTCLLADRPAFKSVPNFRRGLP